MKGIPGRPGEQPSKARQRLLMAGTLLIPVLFFVLVEGLLRLTGFGDDYPLFVEVPGFPAYLQLNPDVGRRYFAQSSVVPSPPADALLREKTPRTLRLFVQGGSTAAGFPYGHGGSFPRMLHQRLQQTYPDRAVEVVNTAMAAVNSYTLLDFADGIVAQQPDAVLIYAGHNEYYGALGVGSTETFGAAQLYLALDHLRLVQALRALWVKLAGATAEPRPRRAPGATLMEDMARERSIPLGSTLYRKGLDQFRTNLSALLCQYQRAGIPVLIGTLASNERNQPPFVSGFSPTTDTTAWMQQYKAARDMVHRGDTTGALSALDLLIRSDDRAADAPFEKARLADAAGRYREARAGYLAAKDRDELRFRAPEAMNTIIRETADACGATVVETQDALADASPGRIIGHTLILEHLHPNLDGYFLLADAFYEALRASPLLDRRAPPVPEADARRAILVTPLDSVLASIQVRRLLNNWPFQPPGVTRPDTLRANNPVEELALDVLQGRRAWLDATAALGARYESQGNYPAALHVALTLIQEQPYRAQPYLLAGNLLVRQERYPEAFGYFQLAEARQPTAEARRMMGRLLFRTGRPADAEAWLQKALVLDARDQAALFDLALVYAATRRPSEARAALQRLLQLNPQHPGATQLLERLPNDQ